jgi:hypothetical protein
MDGAAEEPATAAEYRVSVHEADQPTRELQ